MSAITRASATLAKTAQKLVSISIGPGRICWSIVSRTPRFVFHRHVECVGYVTASSSSGLLWRMEMGMVQFLIGDFVKKLRAVYGAFGI